jgi:hypothetical protein
LEGDNKFWVLDMNIVIREMNEKYIEDLDTDVIITISCSRYSDFIDNYRYALCHKFKCVECPIRFKCYTER